MILGVEILERYPGIIRKRQLKIVAISGQCGIAALKIENNAVGRRAVQGFIIYRFGLVILMSAILELPRT